MTSSAPTTFDYRELARECLREADETTDEARRKTLIGMARMYNHTAIQLDAFANGAGAPSDAD
jgi:hypothetical protein